MEAVVTLKTMSCTKAIIFSLISKASKTHIGNIQVPYQNKTSIRILYLLKKEGFIRNFIYTVYSISIFLKYGGTSNIPTIKSIKILGSSGRALSVTLKVLHSISHLNETLMLTTPRGLITNKTSITLKTGGLLICKII